MDAFLDYRPLEIGEGADGASKACETTSKNENMLNSRLCSSDSRLLP
jgi:hypothetical protein